MRSEIPIVAIWVGLALAALVYLAWLRIGRSPEEAVTPEAVPAAESELEHSPAPPPARHASSRLPVAPVADTAPVELDAEPALPLFHGRVLDALDENPIQGARIHSDEDRATTDPAGDFVLRLPDGANYAAVVDAEGYGRAYFTVDAQHVDSARPSLLRLHRAGVLLASVLTANGDGVSGMEVWLRAEAAELALVDGRLPDVFSLGEQVWSAITDARGEARIADLPPGAALRVELRKEGRSVSKLAQPIHLPPGEVAEREFTIGAGTTILGHVREATGALGGFLAIWQDDALLFAGGLVPGDRLDVLVPAGEVLLFFRPRGREEPIESRVTGSASARLTVELGDS